MTKIIKFCSTVIFFSLFVVACSSLNEFGIPGEIEAKRNNIYIEYMNLGDSYFELAKYDKAIEYYNLALKNKEIYWVCYFKLGRTYALAKKYTEARKIYNRLLKRDKNNTDIQISLAYLYAMEGKTDSAISIYEYLCSKEEYNADILVNYINVLILDEQLNYAKSKLTLLKEKFPDNQNIETFEKNLLKDDSDDNGDEEDSEETEK